MVLEQPSAASQPSTPEFGFSGVSKSFDTRDGVSFVAVEGIDLEVRPGRFVAIVGPSGCGKSTLLNMAAGLMRPTSGAVLHRGAPIGGPNTSVGYLTQHDDLLPWRTVQRNVALPLEVKGIGRRERAKRVEEVLDQVGLTGFERRYPAQLSGGMRKRTAIARTLVYRPATLLMDEPFGALDAQLRRVLQKELIELWQQEDLTVMLVTHDLEEAIYLADEVIVFASRPGRIIAREEVSFPRPRDEWRTTPEFIELHERLWKLLEPEVEA